MRKFLNVVIGIILSCVSVFASADTSTVQRILYVNGIQNTQGDALKAVRRIECILMSAADIAAKDPANNTCPNAVGSENHQGGIKRSFVVDYSYNPIGFYGTADGQWDVVQDMQELFLMKTAEEVYLPYLQKLYAPHDKAFPVVDHDAAFEVGRYANSQMVGRSKDVIDATGGTSQTQPGDNEAVYDGTITSEMMNGTAQATMNLVSRFESVSGDGYNLPTVIVAHSQGNLIANIAYAYLAANVLQDDIGKRVRIVNLANTTRISLHELSLTHEGDRVLFEDLRDIASDDLRPGAFSRTSSWCGVWQVCQFQLDLPTLKAPSNQTPVDQKCLDEAQVGTEYTCDHQVLYTYLSDREVGVKPGQHRGVNHSPLFFPNIPRFRDHFEDLVYHAITSLDNARGGWTPVFHENFNDPVSLVHFNGVAMEDFDATCSSSGCGRHTYYASQGAWGMAYLDKATFSQISPTAKKRRITIHFGISPDSYTSTAGVRIYRDGGSSDPASSFTQLRQSKNMSIGCTIGKSNYTCVRDGLDRFYDFRDAQLFMNSQLATVEFLLDAVQRTEVITYHTRDGVLRRLVLPFNPDNNDSLIYPIGLRFSFYGNPLSVDYIHIDAQN
jgi:hypothetical protein